MKHYIFILIVFFSLNEAQAVRCNELGVSKLNTNKFDYVDISRYISKNDFEYLLKSLTDDITKVLEVFDHFSKKAPSHIGKLDQTIKEHLSSYYKITAKGLIVLPSILAARQLAMPLSISRLTRFGQIELSPLAESKYKIVPDEYSLTQAMEWANATEPLNFDGSYDEFFRSDNYVYPSFSSLRPSYEKVNKMYLEGLIPIHLSDHMVGVHGQLETPLVNFEHDLQHLRNAKRAIGKDPERVKKMSFLVANIEQLEKNKAQAHYFLFIINHELDFNYKLIDALQLALGEGGDRKTRDFREGLLDFAVDRIREHKFLDISQKDREEIKALFVKHMFMFYQFLDWPT